MFFVLRKNTDFFADKRTTIFFFLSIALMFVAHGLQMTVFPLVEQARHMSLHTINLANIMQFGGFLFGALMAPGFVRRSGYGQSFLYTLMALGAVIISFPLLHTPWAFLFNRLASGFVMAIIYANLDSWINEVSVDAIRARMMGVYFIFNFGCIMMGSLLLPLGAVDGYVLPLLGLFIILLSCFIFRRVQCVPLVTQLSHAPSSFVAQLFGAINLVHSLMKNRPLSILGIFVMGMATAPFWDLGPLFATNVPAPLDVSKFMMAVITGGVLGQYPLGKLSDQFERTRTIGWAALLGTLASFIITALPELDVAHSMLYYGFGFLFGACTFHLYMLSASYAFDYVHATRSSFIDISSWYLIIYACGAFCSHFINLGIMLIVPRPTLIFVPSIIGNLCVFSLFCFQIARGYEKKEPIVAPK